MVKILICDDKILGFEVGVDDYVSINYFLLKEY